MRCTMKTNSPISGGRTLRGVLSIPLVRGILLVLVMLGALWLIAPQALDLPRVVAQVRAASPIWLLAALLAQVARYLGTGLLMTLSARAAGQRVSAAAASSASLASGAAARILPFGGAGGIALRAAFLKRQGVNEAAIAGYFVFQNLLGTAWLIVVSLVAVGLLGASAAAGASPAALIPAAVMAVLAAVGLAQLIRHPDTAHRLAAGAGRRLDALLRRCGRDSALESKLPYLLSQALAALNIGAHVRGGLWLAALYSSWTILGDILSLHFSGQALGLSASLSQGVVAYAAASLAGSAVGMPAGVGVTEGAMAATYAAMSHPLDLSLSAVLLFRALSFWLPIPLGLLAAWHLRRQHAL